MSKIETLILRARNPKKQREFYKQILGMEEFSDGRVGYSTVEAGIKFLPAQQIYSPRKDDLYWKIALAVPNIELACIQLQKKGIVVDTPRQFRDVGYLAHFTDPEGFTIELIEHYFKGDRPLCTWDDTKLGGGAHLNLITLRTADIARAESVVIKLGMEPLSVQPVDSHGFTLYFYAFTTEALPSTDLEAIENRTWLYQRPYSILEIQHVKGLNQTYMASSSEAGYQGLYISNPKTLIEENELKLLNG